MPHANDGTPPPQRPPAPPPGWPPAGPPRRSGLASCGLVAGIGLVVLVLLLVAGLVVTHIIGAAQEDDSSGEAAPAKPAPQSYFPDVLDEVVGQGCVQPGYNIMYTLRIENPSKRAFTYTVHATLYTATDEADAGWDDYVWHRDLTQTVTVRANSKRDVTIQAHPQKEPSGGVYGCEVYKASKTAVDED